MTTFQAAGALLKDNLDDIGKLKDKVYIDLVSPVPFQPIILSIGGTPSHRTPLLFNHWSTTSPCWKRVLEQMSVYLLHTRTQLFEMSTPIRP